MPREFTPEDREKAQAARRARPSARERMAAYRETFAEQRRRFPRWALPLIAKAEAGSLQAAKDLMCHDCVNCSGRAEIRDCPIFWCPLWPHRPYQRPQDQSAQEQPPGSQSASPTPPAE
jgi:hypothetical protein